MALLTAAQYLDLRDARTVAGRLLDNGKAATEQEMLDEDTTPGRRLAEAINGAISRLWAAVRVGNRYTRLELENIQSPLARQILAGLVDGHLLMRRQVTGAKFDELAPAYAQSETYLEELRTGNRIFDDVATVDDAGLPHADDTRTRPGIDEPSLIDNFRLFGNLSPSVRPSGCQNQCW